MRMFEVVTCQEERGGGRRSGRVKPLTLPSLLVCVAAEPGVQDGARSQGGTNFDSDEEILCGCRTGARREF